MFQPYSYPKAKWKTRLGFAKHEGVLAQKSKKSKQAKQGHDPSIETLGEKLPRNQRPKWKRRGKWYKDQQHNKDGAKRPEV